MHGLDLLGEGDGVDSFLALGDSEVGAFGDLDGSFGGGEGV